uniref:SS18 N-terminal domain-containing protein n=2 Tax=Cyprinus carpio TaxID=7962 RepID=A0A8C2Q8W5_CYPCA
MTMTLKPRAPNCLTLCFQLLDENDQLMRCITEYLQKDRAIECVQYQQILHRNIVYSETIADASTEIQPETQISDDSQFNSLLTCYNKCEGTVVRDSTPGG